MRAESEAAPRGSVERRQTPNVADRLVDDPPKGLDAQVDVVPKNTTYLKSTDQFRSDRDWRLRDTHSSGGREGAR